MAKSGTFSLKVWISFRNHRFFNEKCSKDSSGHAECIFDNPCQTVLPKVQFFNSEYKITKKSSFFKSFSLSHFFSWHVDWSFGDPAVFFWQSPEFFRSKYKIHSKIIVFSIKNAQNIPLDTPNASWTTLAKLFCPQFNFF